MTAAKCFDTSEWGFGNDSNDFEDFITYDVPEGCIVVAACQDECARNLSDYGREWFGSMGSEDISNGEDHEQKGFVFIGVSGEKGAAHEKVTGEA